jgi:hypothetical protein
MPVIYTLTGASWPKYGYKMNSAERKLYPDVIEFTTERDARIATRLRRWRIQEHHNLHDHPYSIDACEACLIGTNRRG